MAMPRSGQGFLFPFDCIINRKPAAESGILLSSNLWSAVDGNLSEGPLLAINLTFSSLFMVFIIMVELGAIAELTTRDPPPLLY